MDLTRWPYNAIIVVAVLAAANIGILILGFFYAQHNERNEQRHAQAYRDRREREVSDGATRYLENLDKPC